MEFSIESLRTQLPIIYKDCKWALIDCGAYKGEFTKDVSSILKPTKTVLIEANPNLASELVKLFAQETSVTVEAMAVGQPNSEINFNLYDDLATSSILEDPNKSKETKLVNVKTISLNQVIERANCEIFLKTDLQGYDLEAIKLINDANWTRIRVCVIEFIQAPLYLQQGDTLEILNLIHSKGFSIFQISDLHSTQDGQLAFGNFVFVKKQLLPEYSKNQTLATFQANEFLSPITKVYKTAADERLKLIDRLSEEIQTIQKSGLQSSKTSRFEKLKSFILRS